MIKSWDIDQQKSTKNGCQQLCLHNITQLHPQNQHPRHPVDQKSRLLQARQVVGCLSETSETPKIRWLWWFNYHYYRHYNDI